MKQHQSCTAVVAASFTVKSVVCMSLLALVGCKAPAEIIWSHGGERALYQIDGHAVLLDRGGNVLADLGGSVVASAWSKSSDAFFFVTDALDDGSVKLTPVDSEVAPSDRVIGSPAGISLLEAVPLLVPQTRPGDTPTTKPTTAPALGSWEQIRQSNHLLTVNIVDGDGQRMLFRIRSHCPFARLAVSPDDSWLAMGTPVTDIPLFWAAPMPDVYAYSIQAGKLLGIASWCSDFCFTGPDRLACVQYGVMNERSAGFAEAMAGTFGELIEVPLKGPTTRGGDAPSAKLLLTVMPPFTGRISPAAGDLIFTAYPVTFPSLPEAKAEFWHLYRLTLRDGELKTLSDHAGPDYFLSPGGGRILFETYHTGKHGEQSVLAVMRIDGSGRKYLRQGRELVGCGPFTSSMRPSWRTEEQIVLPVPAPSSGQRASDRDGEAHYDVVLYELSGNGHIRPIRTLSDEWKQELRPYDKIWRPATQPTTVPATRPS
jgi:hypothetical protein